MHFFIAIELLEAMLKLDPDQRITSEDAIKHPYLVKYHDPDDEVGKPGCMNFYRKLKTIFKLW